MSAIGPGDLVLCVDAAPDRVDPLANLLVEGRTYRVAVAGNRKPDGVEAVAFREICPAENNRQAYAFSVRRFRPLNDTPDDAELIARIKGRGVREPSREPANA